MSTHGGPTEIPLLDSVISNAVTPGSDVSTALSPEDREDISLLFLEVRKSIDNLVTCSFAHINLGVSVSSLQLQFVHFPYMRTSVLFHFTADTPLRYILHTTALLLHFIAYVPLL